MAGLAGATAPLVVSADPNNRILEGSESNNTATVEILFAGPETCGNYFDNDLDGLIDEGCGLPPPAVAALVPL